MQNYLPPSVSQTLLSWHHRTGCLDQPCPVSGLAEALWLLGSSGQDGAHHPKGNYSLHAPPPPDWKQHGAGLHLLIWTQSNAKEATTTRVRHRCLESVCTTKAVFSNTWTLVHLATETFKPKAFVRRKPAPTFEKRVILHKPGKAMVTYPWLEVLMNAQAYQNPLLLQTLRLFSSTWTQPYPILSHLTLY